MDPISVLKALGDESRMRLVNVLSHGAFNVQELTAILDLSQSTVSHHLRTLQQAGVIKGRREGTWSYYALGNTQESPLASSITKSIIPALGEANGTSPYSRDLQRARETVDRRRDRTRMFFDTVAKEWKQLRHEAGDHERGFSELLRKIPSAGTLLELGCGSGALLERVLPRKGETIAVDYSAPMLEETKRVLGSRSASVDLRLGNLEHLPVADNSVDCAVASMVFHHLPSPAESLQDALRVLRPGGLLLVLDLKKHSNEKMREQFADLWLGFDPQEVATWAEHAGFCEVQIELFGEKGEVFLLSAFKDE